jgi:hypothetical protein
MKVHFELIYEHIGQLFYAVASERSKLDPITYDTLKRLIDQEWNSKVNGDSTLQSHLLDNLHAGVHNAMRDLLSAEHAFENFVTYFALHSFPFSEPMRSKILSTAKTIASEFSGGTKSEFVSKLETVLELKSIPVP